MFDIGPSELLLVVIVAIVVIGPKDLPRAMYKAGQVIGKARAMARHFRSGVDAMIREAELEDLQKQWAQQNAEIMAQHPMEPLPPEKQLVDESGDTAALPASGETSPPAEPGAAQASGNAAPQSPAHTSEQKPEPKDAASS